MARGFVGSGLAFPLALDASGRVALVRDVDVIRRSMWLILSTALGERMMRPDFGCGLMDYIFAAPSAELLGQLAAAVELAIARWEPRVTLVSVDVRLDEADPSALSIEIDARILAGNTPLNLVYPFYLGGASDDV